MSSNPQVWYLTIRGSGEAARTVELTTGALMDLDKHGRVLGFETIGRTIEDEDYFAGLFWMGTESLYGATDDGADTPPQTTEDSPAMTVEDTPG